MRKVRATHLFGHDVFSVLETILAIRNFPNFRIPRQLVPTGRIKVSVFARAVMLDARISRIYIGKF